MHKGTILKLKSQYKDVIEYSLPLGKEDIALNPLVGEKIKLEFTGDIFCIDTGKKLKKSYGQGYSWESFITLPECDTCIVRPELCHHHMGTCRDNEWAEKHCLQPHIIYIANSSQVKVGITRKANTPYRWIDQGASFALPIAEVKDRRTSGLIEIEIAKKLGDKTNWRKMLQNDIEDINLIEVREKVKKDFAELFKTHKAKLLEEEVLSFQYPVESYPEKITSLTLEKSPIIEGKLLGIKGQYLIFDCGVLNMRRHQGYEIVLN